ncbi:Serine/threonine-protein phosphatase 6 regulatory ankyrin repeat subunit B [Vitis vinifera]|uniref:Serine/threonine-protein phosphatase 6 regulatory ankyrin repeat subunit B n=1 Tax=Vitis vinifera TaxID=29760 RepID=A0A438CQK1_VITVI|nr:Serine/threonine-protein phosphatase 6 regulatory ankyrin repeat subunit B [Vitis vinifera]
MWQTAHMKVVFSVSEAFNPLKRNLLELKPRETNEISYLYLHIDFDSSHRKKKNITLHIAARIGNKKIVQELLIEGTLATVLTKKNSKHETALHIATRSGHVHVVLRMGNMKANTPLHEAVRNGHHSTVLVLVEANDSDLFVSLNNAGKSPLFMAIDTKASEIVKTILPKPNPSSLLHKSFDPLGNSNIKTTADPSLVGFIQHLVNEKDSCGKSPLHYAAASGVLALVDHLLQLKPSNGSFLDGNLTTPAHMATENGHLNHPKNGHLKVVRYIQNMFMVNDLLNETDEDGNTPLHLAAAKLHSNILVLPSNEVNEGTNGNQAQATPNEIGCAGDEKIEAKKQRTTEILKAVSAKQAKKLKGILEQEDFIIESIRDKRRKEMAGTLIVMATLVATVTFTAASTLPGGVHSEGPHKGMAVLTRKAAFKAFIVIDTVAMTTSMTVVLMTKSTVATTSIRNGV